MTWKLTVTLAAVAFVTAAPVCAEEATAPYLYDRGSGVTTSLFGTYIRGGELLFYLFCEYEKNNGEEYKGVELGTSTDQTDYLGKFRLHQALLFFGYGFTDDFALEVEVAAYERAKLTPAINDITSGAPAELKESGFGTLESSLRWRVMRETEDRPDVFTYLQLEYPLLKKKHLIGVQKWAGSLGAGVVKGFSFGTLTARAEVAYDGADKQPEFGEWAVEYLKRINDRWRVVAAVEGQSDEVSAIGELQWQIAPNAVIKINGGFGLTKKAVDFAPEIGVMFRF